jgi:hypothetical protein
MISIPNISPNSTITRYRTGNPQRRRQYKSSDAPRRGNLLAVGRRGGFAVAFFEKLEDYSGRP